MISSVGGLVWKCEKGIEFEMSKDERDTCPQQNIYQVLMPWQNRALLC